MLACALALAVAGAAASVLALAGVGPRSGWEAAALACAVGVAGVLATALVWARATRAREEGVRLVDPITGLGNGNALADELRRRLRRDRSPLHLIIFDLEGFKKYNDSYGRACGDALLWRLAHKLEAAVAPCPAFRLRGDEFAALVADSDGDATQVEVRAVNALYEIGEGFMIRCAHGGVELPREAEDVSEALKLADQRVHAERSSPEFAAAVAEEEPVLPAAPRLPAPRYDVAELAARVALRLGISEREGEELEMAAQLRDVGNMAIPDAILQSPGRMGDDEWRFIRFHTLVGERLLGAGFGMHRVAALVRSSHERWDGEGYPDGLRGDDIPLGSRVIFACSAFQDMTSERAHRPALGAEAALEEMRRCAGTQFDPTVVDAFADVFAAGLPQPARYLRT